MARPTLLGYPVRKEKGRGSYIAKTAAGDVCFYPGAGEASRVFRVIWYPLGQVPGVELFIDYKEGRSLNSFIQEADDRMGRVVKGVRRISRKQVP